MATVIGCRMIPALLFCAGAKSKQNQKDNTDGCWLIPTLCRTDTPHAVPLAFRLLRPHRRCRRRTASLQARPFKVVDPALQSADGFSGTPSSSSVARRAYTPCGTYNRRYS